MHRSSVVSLWFVLLVACGGAPEQAQSSAASTSSSDASALAEARSGSSTPHALLRASLLAADRLLAQQLLRAGVVEGYRHFLDEDVAFLVPLQNIAFGRQAALDALHALYPDPSVVKLEQTQWTGDVSADGRLGYTFGYGTQTTTNSDGTQSTRNTRYVGAWRRDEHHWKLEAYLWSFTGFAPSDPPAGFPLFTPGEHGTPHWNFPRRNAAEVSAADSAFAHLSVTQGYSIAFADYVAPDGVQVAGPMYWGIDAVIAAWAGWTPVETEDWSPARARSTFSGDLGWSVGPASYTLRNDDGTIALQSFSKYLTVWARQPDGSWKYILDIGNGRPAP